MKRLSFVLLFVLLVLGLRAEDYGASTEFSVQQNLGVRGLSANAGLGFRSNNHLRNVDRWSASVGLGYSVCPYLKVSAFYSYMYAYKLEERKESFKNSTGLWNGYNLTHPYWRSKNRLSVDLKTGIDVGRFSFSLRERYQLTGYNSLTATKDKYRFNVVMDENNEVVDYLPKSQESEPDFKPHKSKEYCRSKLEASYNIRHCRLTPYVSFELINNLREGFLTEGSKYAAGFDYKISKKVYLGAEYRYNHGQDDDDNDNIHLLELSLKLKNIFWTKKK